MKNRDHTYTQHIAKDVRAYYEQNEPSKKKLRKLTQKMIELKTEPPIFPLFKKLYLPEADLSPKPQDNPSSSKPETTNSCPYNAGAFDSTGIMHRKLKEHIKKQPQSTPEQAFQTLRFTEDEIQDINNVTLQQWQSQEWFIQKAGFITASKSKHVFTRQTTIEMNKAKGKSTDVSILVSAIVKPTMPAHTKPIEHGTTKLKGVRSGSREKCS